MNEATIEQLLRLAPSPAASPELLSRLQAEISLPQKSEAARDTRVVDWRNPLRRWIPALAFGLFLLTCVILVGMQAYWLNQLRNDNEQLHSVVASLPDLRNSVAQMEHSRLQLAGLERLRQDNEALHRLQAEVAELRALPTRIAELRAENERLSESLLASGNPELFYEEVKKEAERIACINHLKQLGLAVRIWAADQQDRYPTSLIVMSNELDVAKILVCPGDTGRQAYASLSWDEFRDEMSSYEFMAQPEDEKYPDRVISKCPIHHNYGLADGSVQSVDPAKVREVRREGRLYLEIQPQGAQQ